MQKFHTAIIGGGIGGLMTAYRLKTLDPAMSVVVYESGHSIDKRVCPASDKKSCAHCKNCSITSGFAGAGAFSDGKFNLGTAYGGTLGEAIGDNTAMRYINEVDRVLEHFSEGKYPALYRSCEELKLKCLQNNLRLLDMNVRHLGTDKNFATMKSLIDWLTDNGVLMLADTHVVSVRDENGCRVLEGENGDLCRADNIVIATGRGGGKFVIDFCRKHNIHIRSNSVDIGVRVEMMDIIWREFSSKIYEPKILYRTKTFEDRTRMFCFNQGGLVSAENNNGIITANGHAYAEPEKKTDNCNFAILSSIHFTEPFNKPTEYAENIARMANMIGNGNVLIQRFGDLIRGRRTNDHRLAQNTVIPTLKATAGDLSLVLPHRMLTNIIETIYALDRVAPGCANDDTLLYGCENKYYSLRPETDEDFRLIEGVYLIGDGSGITRGLSQAGAMGLYVADRIAK